MVTKVVGLGGGDEVNWRSARSPARIEPMNNGFLRPSEKGRMTFSIGSLSIARPRSSR